MTEQPQELQSRKLSEHEREFLQRWRELVDRVGGDSGQTRVASRLHWSTSTVSRYYRGQQLPPDERLDQLCDYLKLTASERVDLRVLLRSAREANDTRRKITNSSLELVSDATPTAGMAVTPGRDTTVSHHNEAVPVGTQSSVPTRGRRPIGRWIVAFAAVVVVVAGVLVWRPWHTNPPQASIQTSYRGEGLKAVAIPVTSLTPTLQAAFRHGRTASAATITGYEFRNAQDASLCLTAVDTGPTAGHNGDRVELAACKLTPSQIWIPQQWEIDQELHTHLVSDKYQSMCLNADNIGGLRNGHRAQLWHCYPANNEAWSFADWYHNVKPGAHADRLCLHGQICLGVDNRYGHSGQVDIWSQSPVAGQFWS